MAEESPPVLRVCGQKLCTPDGEPLMLRGVNKMFVWRDPNGVTVPEIAKSGANAVRVVWTREGALVNLEKILADIAEHGMVAIPELHDGTVADREDAGWGMLSELVDWWVSEPVVELLQRHRSHVILNIANELGKTVPVSQFIDEYQEAVLRIRNTGLQVPIMIDCNEYGKNIQMIRDAGPAIIEVDPERNVLFSVHTWWHLPWGWTQEKAEREMKLTIESGIPFVIGEFSGAGIDGKPIVDYDPLLRLAEAHQIGYLIWSWGPGNGDNPDMDMTEDGTFSTLHGYGKHIVNHPDYGFRHARQLWAVGRD